MENDNLDPRELQSEEAPIDQLLGTMEVQIIESILIHPFTYAKKLIQIGYEPLPPTKTRLYYIGPHVLILPNMFSYVKHIYDVDGVTGCFRGLTACMSLNVSSAIIYQSIIMANIDAIKDSANDHNYFALIKWDVLATTAAIFFSHPFYVVSNRQMASFVGGETKYNGLFKGLYEIAVDEGMTSWFSGFFPRLIGNLTEILLFYALFFIIHKYVFTDRAHLPFVTIGSKYFATLVAYPFHVVGVCMSVNGSALQVGVPPFTPYFEHSWVKCYKYLSKIQQLRRGETAFWRPFIPPVKLE